MLKRFEDDSLLFGGDADAGIAHRESNDFADAVERIEIILFILWRRRDLQHNVALFGELESVGKQVHEYLLQTLIVCNQGRSQLVASLDEETEILILRELVEAALNLRGDVID